MQDSSMPIEAAEKSVGVDVIIRSADWAVFCGRFSHQHHGWLITVAERPAVPPADATDSVSQEPRVIARDLPLGEVRVDRVGRSVRIVVTAGAPSSTVRYVVADPSRLVFERTPEGAHRGLSIESPEGRTTEVRFRVPILPEMVDGLAAGF